MVKKNSLANIQCVHSPHEIEHTYHSCWGSSAKWCTQRQWPVPKWIAAGSCNLLGSGIGGTTHFTQREIKFKELWNSRCWTAWNTICSYINARKGRQPLLEILQNSVWERSGTAQHRVSDPTAPLLLPWLLLRAMSPAETPWPKGNVTQKLISDNRDKRVKQISKSKTFHRLISSTGHT